MMSQIHESTTSKQKQVTFIISARQLYDRFMTAESRSRTSIGEAPDRV